MRFLISRSEIIELFNKLVDMQNIKGTKFSFFINTNLSVLQNLMHEFELKLTPSEEYKKWESVRTSLCETFANKDKDGKPIIKNQKYIIGNELIFNKELEKLKFGYTTAIKEHEDKLKKFRETLTTAKENVELNTINRDDLPNDLTANQLHIFDFLIIYAEGGGLENAAKKENSEKENSEKESSEKKSSEKESN